MNDFDPSPEIKDADPGTLKPSIANFASLEFREGVFVHSFKCMNCSLEFAVFSWWPDRHSVVNTACPECQEVTQKIHWLAQFSDSREMVLDDSSTEIFHLSPIGSQAQVQADSSVFTGMPAAKPEAGHSNSNDAN